MAIVTTDNQHYSNIAAAIRQKLNSQDAYKPEDMAAAIGSITTGGGLKATISSQLTVSQVTLIFSTSVEDITETV